MASPLFHFLSVSPGSFSMPRFHLLFLSFPGNPAYISCLGIGHSALYYTNPSSHSLQISHNRRQQKTPNMHPHACTCVPTGMSVYTHTYSTTYPHTNSCTSHSQTLVHERESQSDSTHPFSCHYAYPMGSGEVGQSVILRRHSGWGCFV